MHNKDNLRAALTILRHAIKDNAELSPLYISQVQAVVNDLEQLENGNMIASCWNIDDVDCALEMEQDENTPEADRKTLTLEQKRQVLHNLELDHNAGIGINWDVLQLAVSALI
jgi:hypothetical protein